MTKRKKTESIEVLSPSQIVIDCYRIKVEIVDGQNIRIYTYNSHEKGDVAITLKGSVNEVKVVGEHVENKTFTILPQINPSRRTEETKNGEYIEIC